MHALKAKLNLASVCRYVWMYLYLISVSSTAELKSIIASYYYAYSDVQNINYKSVD